MEFNIFSVILDMMKNLFLQWVHWNKMSAHLTKVSQRNNNTILTYILSNTGSHQLMVSDLEVEVGNTSTNIPSQSIDLPILVQPKEMEEIIIEIPNWLFHAKKDASYFVVIMTVRTLKGRIYYLYKEYSLDQSEIDFKPFKLDKHGRWIKRRYGV